MATQRAPPTKLRARGKKRPYQPKKRLGFLDLPGEIRNEIYAYCFEDEIWVDMTPDANHVLSASSISRGAAPRLNPTAITPSPTPTTNPTNPASTHHHGPVAAAPKTLSVPKKPQKIRYRRHKDRTRSLSPANWARTPGALTRTSRQIHAESLPFFYATVFFIFSAPNALLRFVRGGRRGRGALAPAKLALIRKLHVAHATYGDPDLTRDVMWKERSDARWALAMREAAARLTGLRVLRLRVVVNDRPMVFGMGAWWVRALMVWEACRRPAGEQDETKKEALQVTVAVQSQGVAKAMGNMVLREPMMELHRLFSEAVMKRLAGWGEEEAMGEYYEAKWGKWAPVVERFPMP